MVADSFLESCLLSIFMFADLDEVMLPVFSLSIVNIQNLINVDFLEQGICFDLAFYYFFPFLSYLEGKSEQFSLTRHFLFDQIVETHGEHLKSEWRFILTWGELSK